MAKIQEVIEENVEVQDEPSYAFVTFQSLKNVNKKGESKSVARLRKSIWHFDVSGSHNTPQALTEVERRGAVCIGSGNLHPRNHREVIGWVRARTGEGVHPSLRTNAMEQKIAAAEQVLKEEKAKESEVKVKKPKLEVVTDERQ